MFVLRFTQRKEHISQRQQNRAQQDILALKISSLMYTDALLSTVIYLKGSSLKRPSSSKQPDKFIGQACEYKDILWAEAGRQGVHIIRAQSISTAVHIWFILTCTLVLVN